MEGSSRCWRRRRKTLIRILTKFFGGVILAFFSFLFVVFTASINEAPSMGGPMAISPGPKGWFYIVVVVDVLLLIFVWFGITLLGFGRRALGVWSLLVTVPILIFGIRNHINAPPLDGINPTNKMPIPDAMHFILYGVVGILLFAGLWLTAKRDSPDVSATSDASS